MTLALLGCAPFDGNFVLADANNYAYTSHLEISAQEVEVAQDFSIDWSGLTVDLLGHDMDPAADVGEMYLLSIPALSHDAVEDALGTESLSQSDLLVIALDTSTEGTSMMASDLTILPNADFVPEDYLVDTESSWLLRATDGATTNRMLTFVVPSETSANRAVTLGNDGTILEFAADLQSLEPFAFKEAEAYHLEWSALTTHANGNPIDLGDLDQLLLARYDGKSLADLEAQFLDIELIADAQYTADVYGLREAALTMAEDAGGNAFSGFGKDTLWLLALRCTTCANPAPPFLTVLEVR